MRKTHVPANLIITDLDTATPERISSNFIRNYEQKTQDDLKLTQMQRSRDIQSMNTEKKKMNKIDQSYQNSLKKIKDKKEMDKYVQSIVRKSQERKNGQSPKIDCYIGPGGII